MSPGDVLEALSSDEPIEGIACFPREDVRKVLKDFFSDIQDDDFELNWEGDGSYFQIGFGHATESDVHLIVANCGYELFKSQKTMNRLIEACTSLGCALYDPQEGRRFKQPEPKTRLSMPLLAFCIIMFLASIGTEICTVRIFIKAVRIGSWPTAKATISKSEFDSQFHGKTTYTAHVEYFFDLNGERYSSSSVRTRGTSSQYEGDTKAVLQRFPVGKEVPAYYNSANPHESYLETGVGFVNSDFLIRPNSVFCVTTLNSIC